MATNSQIAFAPLGNTVVIPAAASASTGVQALVPGAVEVLRFGRESFFSGLASAASTVYIVQGEGM